MNVLEITTLILGIVGTVLGIGTLIFQIFSEKKNNVRIIIKNNKNSFYVEQYLTVFNTGCYSFINLKISNCSSYPITIDEIRIAGTNIEHYSDTLQVPCIQPKGILYEAVELNNVCTLPFRIDCFDTVYICLQFPFFENYKDKTTTIEFVTPRKIYYHKVLVHEQSEVFRSSPQ